MVIEQPNNTVLSNTDHTTFKTFDIKVSVRNVHLPISTVPNTGNLNVTTVSFTTLQFVCYSLKAYESHSEEMCKHTTKAGKRHSSSEKAHLASQYTHKYEPTKTSQEDTVLSLAEYVQSQKDATVKDQYASTLPFDLSRATTRVGGRTLERAKARWEWFLQAKELDTKHNVRLGTLGFLPQEIRDIIYGLVIDDQLKNVLDNGSEPFHYDRRRPKTLWLSRSDALVNRRIHFQPCRWRNRVDFGWERALETLWYSPWLSGTYHFENMLKFPYASPTIQKEIDTYLVDNFAFKFDCPRAFSELSEKSPSAKKGHLRSIEIEIFSTCACQGEGQLKDWMMALEHIPRVVTEAFKQVNIDLGHQVHLCLSPSLHECTQDRKRPTEYFHEVKEMRCAMDALKVLFIQVSRRASRAEVYVLGERHYLGQDEVVRGSVLGSDD